MPELPEVEVTRQSFAKPIAMAQIESVRQGLPLRWGLGCAPAHLIGQQVLNVGRRGKYLLLNLSGGILLIHLGMSGSLRFTPCTSHMPKPGKHDHFDLVTNQGTLRLHDPRRFGAVVFAASQADPQAIKLLGKLGVEPLDDFDLTHFFQSLRSRRAPIKQVLLAGTVVVGVGNIYASEALFLAGIRPVTPAGSLSKPRVQRLRTAIIDVLSAAVRTGGSTLRNFSNAQGEHGQFQQQAKVYGRADLPCLVCGRAIKMLRQGQRSSFYCHGCQK